MGKTFFWQWKENSNGEQLKRSRNEQLRKGESFFEVSWKNWQLQASKTSWSNETQFQRQMVLLRSVRSGISGRHRGDSSEFSGRPLSAVMRDWRPLTRNWRFRFGEEDFSSTSTSLSSGDSPEHRCGLSMCDDQMLRVRPESFRYRSSPPYRLPSSSCLLVSLAIRSKKSIQVKQDENEWRIAVCWKNRFSKQSVKSRRMKCLHWLVARRDDEMSAVEICAVVSLCRPSASCSYPVTAVLTTAANQSKRRWVLKRECTITFLGPVGDPLLPSSMIMPEYSIGNDISMNSSWRHPESWADSHQEAKLRREKSCGG